MSRETPEVRDQLQALSNAVAEYIMELDKLMVGPSTYARGRAQAALVGKLQVAWEDAEECLRKNAAAKARKP